MCKILKRFVRRSVSTIIFLYPYKRVCVCIYVYMYLYLWLSLIHYLSSKNISYNINILIFYFESVLDWCDCVLSFYFRLQNQTNEMSKESKFKERFEDDLHRVKKELAVKEAETSNLSEHLGEAQRKIVQLQNTIKEQKVNSNRAVKPFMLLKQNRIGFRTYNRLWDINVTDATKIF